MDAARQTAVMNQQSMRLKDTEEARKQALFKQGMGNAARVGAAYTGPMPTLDGGPAGGPAGGGTGMKAPAVAPAPGPQAAYNPEADLPGVNANIAQQAMPQSNAPGGYYIPGGPAPAPAPAPAAGLNPFGSIDPNASQYQQYEQSLQQERAKAVAVGQLATQTGSVVSPLVRGYGAVSNYFTPQTPAQRAEYDARISEQSAIAAWYNNPQVQAELRSNPMLLAQAQRDPVGVYNANKTSIVPGTANAAPTAGTRPASAASTQPIVVEGADGKPISINVTQGESDPNMLGASGTTGLGLRGSMAEKIMSTPPGAPTPTPNTNPYLLEPAAIGVQQKQIQDQFKELQTLWVRAQKLRDNATMTNIQMKMIELRSGNELLNGVKAITEFSAGRPEALASTLNKMSGGSFMLQPRADGKFNVYSGDTLTGEGVTKEELIAKSRMIFDQQFQSQVQAGVAANKARADKIFEAQIKGLEEGFKQEAAQNKEINVETAKARLKREFPETDYHHVPDPNGNGVLLYDKKNPFGTLGSKPVAVMTLQKEIGVNGQVVKNPDGTPRIIPQIVKTQ
jgi:hypothetical protein